MYSVISRILAVFALVFVPVMASAQTPEPSQPCPVKQQPPADSGPVICQTELRFHPINESIIEAQTYLYYIQTPFSRPSENVFVPFNDQTETSLQEDFKRLWATNFLDNLWIRAAD